MGLESRTPANNAPGDVGELVERLHTIRRRFQYKAEKFDGTLAKLNKADADTLTDAIAALRRLEGERDDLLKWNKVTARMEVQAAHAERDTLRATVAALEAENEALAGALEFSDMHFQRCLVSDAWMGDDEHEVWAKTRQALAQRATRRSGHATKDL